MRYNNPLRLPRNWILITLGEIFTLEYGKGLRKDLRDSNGKIPVYGSNGIVGYHSIPLVKKPCIIVGRKGTSGAVNISKVPCWPIDTTYYIDLTKELNLDFTYYLLSTLKLDSLDRSTAIPGLNRDDVYDLKIPLPPLKEQKRISSKIEELFTKLNIGIEYLKKTQILLKLYRQSILKHAVEGKLTEKWREKHKNEIEPLLLLLEKVAIKEKTNKNKINKINHVQKEWMTITIEDIANVNTGLTP